MPRSRLLIAGAALLLAGLAVSGGYAAGCFELSLAASDAEFHRPDALLDELGPPYQSIARCNGGGTADVLPGSPIERATAAWVESLRSPRTWRRSLVSAASDGIRLRSGNFDVLLDPKGGLVINLWDSPGPNGQYLSSYDTTAPEYLALVELLDARLAESSD